MKSHNCCIRKCLIYFSRIKYLKEILMLHITCSRQTPSFIVFLWCIFLLLERLIQIAEVLWIFYSLGVVNDQKYLSLICSGLTIQQCSNQTQQRNRLWKQKPSWIIFHIPESWISTQSILLTATGASHMYRAEHISGAK